MKIVLVKTVQDVNRITHGLPLATLAIISNLAQGINVILTDVGEEEIMFTTDKSLAEGGEN